MFGSGYYECLWAIKYFKQDLMQKKFKDYVSINYRKSKLCLQLQKTYINYYNYMNKQHIINLLL